MLLIYNKLFKWYSSFSNSDCGLLGCDMDTDILEIHSASTSGVNNEVNKITQCHNPEYHNQNKQQCPNLRTYVHNIIQVPLL